LSIVFNCDYSLCKGNKKYHKSPNSFPKIKVSASRSSCVNMSTTNFFPEKCDLARQSFSSLKNLASVSILSKANTLAAPPLRLPPLWPLATSPQAGEELGGSVLKLTDKPLEVSGFIRSSEAGTLLRVASRQLSSSAREEVPVRAEERET